GASSAGQHTGSRLAASASAGVGHADCARRCAHSLPLARHGLDGVRDAHVILQHLPEPVWFSRGERRDEHTWDLASADLEDLQMTLRAGAPAAFGVDIEVVGPNAAPLAQSSAFVRLVDAPAPAARSAALADTALAASPARPMPERRADVSGLDWSARTL